VLDDPEHLFHATTIAELSLRHRLPVVSPFRTLAEAGGLISMGQIGTSWSGDAPYTSRAFSTVHDPRSCLSSSPHD
jgi:hypothetical protein